jgi:catechol 2,3-dioxygenase-like lactoylglutathione lyase family enzyme
MAITGVHAILYTDDAAADRAFFAEVLGLTSVDAGDGWLIFALPPAELTQQRWGLITTVKLPGGGRLGLYEPMHPSPLLHPS